MHSPMMLNYQQQEFVKHLLSAGQMPTPTLLCARWCSLAAAHTIPRPIATTRAGTVSTVDPTQMMTCIPRVYVAAWACGMCADSKLGSSALHPC